MKVLQIKIAIKKKAQSKGGENTWSTWGIQGTHVAVGSPILVIYGAHGKKIQEVYQEVYQ